MEIGTAFFIFFSLASYTYFNAENTHAHTYTHKKKKPPTKTTQLLIHFPFNAKLIL